jgi:hypothetical protein
LPSESGQLVAGFTYCGSGLSEVPFVMGNNQILNIFFSERDMRISVHKRYISPLDYDTIVTLFSGSRRNGDIDNKGGALAGVAHHLD